MSLIKSSTPSSSMSPTPSSPHKRSRHLHTLSLTKREYQHQRYHHNHNHTNALALTTTATTKDMSLELDLEELQRSSLNPHQRLMEEMDEDALSTSAPPPAAAAASTSPVAMADEALEPNVPLTPLSVASSTEETKSETEEDESEVTDGDSLSSQDMRSGKQAERTVTIFDWDDTLLPSTFLFSHGLRLDNEVRCEMTLRQLERVQESAMALLNIALQHGSVYIITNAQHGWVELSSRKWLPKLVPMLEELNHIKILSARSRYEQFYPEAPLKWKFCAFQHSLAEFIDGSCPSNVLSLGDSLVEREAVRSVTLGAQNVKTKSIKFTERPSIEHLYKQLDMVANCFGDLTSHDGDLDLMLTVSVVN